jgi:hypothetical protein
VENRLIQLTLHPQRYAWTVGFDRAGLIRSLFRPTFSPVSGLHETFRDQFKKTNARRKELAAPL